MAAALTAELHRRAARRGRSPGTAAREAALPAPARTSHRPPRSPSPLPARASPPRHARPSQGGRPGFRGRGGEAQGRRRPGSGRTARRGGGETASPRSDCSYPNLPPTGPPSWGEGGASRRRRPRKARPTPARRASLGPRPCCRGTARLATLTGPPLPRLRLRQGQRLRQQRGQPRARADGSCSCRLMVHRASRIRIPSRRLRERESDGLLHCRLRSSDVNNTSIPCHSVFLSLFLSMPGSSESFLPSPAL